MTAIPICCEKGTFTTHLECPIHHPDCQAQDYKIAKLKKEIHDFRSIDRHKDKDWGEWYKSYFEKVDSVKALTAEIERLKKESFSLLPHELCNEKIKELTAEVTEWKAIATRNLNAKLENDSLTAKLKLAEGVMENIIIVSDGHTRFLDFATTYQLAKTALEEIQK